MHRCAMVQCLLFATLIAICAGLDRVYLNGTWTLSDERGRYKDLPAIVPGGVYSDLMANKLLPDIFAGFNDVGTRWVSKLSWTYTKEFKVDSQLLSHKNIMLTFEGIDTFAQIYINDQNIGTTENMFVKYQYDIAKYLKNGDNLIKVVLQSPVTLSQQLFDEQSKNYTVVPKTVPKLYNGENHVNHIRKMQASFAWDWGPAFPSMGIWKQVYIIAYNSSFIEDVSVFIDPQEESYVFNLIVYMSGNSDNMLDGQLMISMQTESSHVSNFYDIMESTNNDEFALNVQFTISKAEFNLWWPNGYGDQYLYEIVVQFSNAHDVSEKRMKVGIRTVELVQKPIGDKGMSFYFKVNGMQIFAKGSNMIPSHILPEYSNDESRIRYLMQAAKDVHMNMLRVWGGGMYESDRLYELADEMGIMIWQDFMFGCSMYPTNPPFLRTVEDEVKHQVRRLQYHPSLVLWAGNNENEAALRFNWYGTSKNYSVYEDDYRKLYVDTISKAVKKFDPSRKYLVSSPTNGQKSEEEGHVAKNPQDNSYGDIHYYNYIFDGWNQNIYPVPRFSSEYGYQSLPNVLSIITATQNMSDLSVNSDFMKHRQHHPLGYLEMKNLIGLRLKLPSNSSSLNLNYARAFIFYSQIYQAMAIKVETEHYRQWRGRLNEAQEGQTMGALYWQLNDVWIGPTWSGIDFTGRWKMLHYYAKDFFAPVIVTSHLLPNNDVKVFAISDLPRVITNVTLSIKVYNWNSFDSVYETNRTFHLFTGSEIQKEFNVMELMNTIDKCPGLENCFLRMSLKKGDLVAPDHTLFPIALKKTTITDSLVKIVSVKQLNISKYFITISATQPAVFVWVESMVKGTFSENGFHLVEPQKTIVFTLQENFNGSFKDTLLITHLRDKQYFY